MSAIVVAGRFTQDGEIRTTPGGTRILIFGIAENVRINNQEQAQFFNCQMFGSRAEKLAPYIKKGSPATVFGSLQIRPYTDRQGIGRQSIDIIVGDITLQGSRQTDSPPARQAPSSTPQEDIDSDILF